MRGWKPFGHARVVLVFVWLSILQPGAARADDSPTHVRWKGWTVTSSEGLWRGRKHRGYPLTYLFDDDPSTAWVFSGRQPDRDLGNPYYLTLRADAPVQVDEIRIMNGYNKSRATFVRNNRVVEMRVLGAGDAPGTVALPDEMGWHAVRLPGAATGQLILEFTQFKQGAEDDLCLSGLALFFHGRKLDLRMPQVVIQSDGGEAESNTSYLMTRAGRRLAGDEAGPYESGGAAWSADGKRVASLERQEALRFWVADATTGKILLKRPVPHLTGNDEYEIEWSGPRLVRLKIQYLTKDGRPSERVLPYPVP